MANCIIKWYLYTYRPKYLTLQQPCRLFSMLVYLFLDVYWLCYRGGPSPKFDWCQKWKKNFLRVMNTNYPPPPPPPLYHINIGPWKPFAGTKVTKTKSTADAPGATIKKAFRNCYKMNCIICRNKPVTLESMFVGDKFIPHFKDLLGVLCWLQQLCNSLAGLKHLVFSFNILFKCDFHLHLCSVSE